MFRPEVEWQVRLLATAADNQRGWANPRHTPSGPEREQEVYAEGVRDILRLLLGEDTEPADKLDALYEMYLASVDGKVRLTLSIDNAYPDGVVKTTEQVTVDLPDEYDETALYDWAVDNLSEYTGTGRTSGEAIYTVTVTASTEPRLTGRVFEFGG